MSMNFNGTNTLKEILSSIVNERVAALYPV
jgi:hypothetical protein